MLNNLGLSYFENNEYNLAEDHFTQAITNAESAKDKTEENNENLSFYYKNRGLANYHLGKVEEAERDYDVAIRHNTHNADNYFNRGKPVNYFDPDLFDFFDPGRSAECDRLDETKPSAGRHTAKATANATGESQHIDYNVYVFRTSTAQADYFITADSCHAHTHNAHRHRATHTWS